MTSPQKVPCDLLIRNAHVVTMDPAKPEHPRGALAIAGSRIAAVGPESEIVAAYEPRAVIDAGGALAHPGLIDTHVHLTTTIMRTLIPENSVASAADLANAVGEYFDCVTGEQENRATLLSCCEYLLAGFTTVVDPGTIGDTEAAAAAVREVGMRAFLGEPFLQDRDLGQISTKRYAATRDRCEKLLGSQLQRNRDPDALVKGQIALYGLGTATTSLVQMAVEKAREAGAPMTMHESFMPGDLKNRADLEGRHPFVHWSRIGVLDAMKEHLNFVHCNIIHADEVAPIGQAHTTITWCPHNLLYYGIQKDVVRPMTELYRNGANVTLGHDFVKCFQAGDEAMFAYVVSHMWGDALLPDDLMKMSTTNAAGALNMGGEIGALKAGYRADVVIRRKVLLENLPAGDALKSALLLGRSKSVDTVIVDGKVRVRNGELAQLDLGDVYNRVDRAAGEIAKQLKL